MSRYGAYLLDENGDVFYEDGMDVITFKDKISIRLDSTEHKTIGFDLMTPSTIPIIPFIKYRSTNINNPDSPYCELKKSDNNNWKLLFVFIGYGFICDVDIYIFSINLIQPIPKYGMALFNENGMCVLTNETKRLSLANSGEINSFKTNITLNGSFAVFPQYSGGIVLSWRDPQGGDVRMYDIDYSYAAVSNGSQTRIYGGAGTSAGPGGTISGSSSHDEHSPSLYIDTTPYD